MHHSDRARWQSSRFAVASDAYEALRLLGAGVSCLGQLICRVLWFSLCAVGLMILCEQANALRVLSRVQGVVVAADGLVRVCGRLVSRFREGVAALWGVRMSDVVCCGA